MKYFLILKKNVAVIFFLQEIIRVRRKYISVCASKEDTEFLASLVMKNCVDMQTKGYDLTMYESLGKVKMNILVIRAQQFLFLSLDNLKLVQVSAGSEYSLH